MRPTRGWILVALLALATPATAGDDVKEALRALRGARSAADRLAVIPRLAAADRPKAALALAHLVATDPDLEVRRRAAHALGRSRAGNATALLLERALAGGPLAVRDAVAWALAKQEDAGSRVVASLRMRGRTRLERGLLARTLGAFRDPTTRDALEALLDDGDAHVAAVALDAYCSREDTASTRLAVLARRLLEGRYAGDLLPALDAAARCPDPVLEAPLRRLETFLEPGVRDAAEHLLAVIDARRVGGEASDVDNSTPEDGHRYGTPRTPPPARPPDDVPARSRHDVVYVIDATGSTASTLAGVVERVLRQIRILEELGQSLRIGVVAYRGGRGDAARRRGLEVLPLSYDREEVLAFLEALEPHGVDDRGAQASVALRLALDQMPWRRAAWRRVRLVADGPCDQPHEAEQLAGLHYRADRTRTHVAYVLRTRSGIPAEWREIARAGGTGAAEAWE